MSTNNAVNNYTQGKILQYQYVNGAASSTASTTPVDITGSSVSITPSSVTSQILIIATIFTEAAAAANHNGDCYIQCLRGASVIGGTPYGTLAVNAAVSTGGPDLRSIFNFVYVDSPATTSSTTYKLQQYISSATDVTIIDSSNGTLVVMELLV